MSTSTALPRRSGTRYQRWRDQAACQGEDPALFFGPDPEPEADREAREAAAKAVCARCPVTAQCLDWVLGFPSQHGVCGGVGEDERRAMRHAYVKRQARRAA